MIALLIISGALHAFTIALLLNYRDALRTLIKAVTALLESDAERLRMERDGLQEKLERLEEANR